MKNSRNRLARSATTLVLAGTITVAGLFGVANPAAAEDRKQEPLKQQREVATFVLVEQDNDRLGFGVDSTKDTGDQQFCDGTPVPDDIVECDIDEIAWTCINGDTNPLDGGCIGNADKPSVFPED